MNSKEYGKSIIDKLLNKYNKRLASKTETNRRVILKPTELYKSYADNNADIDEKQNFNEAVELLLKLDFVTVNRLKFSLDIEKIYLCEDKVDELYEYLNSEYGIIPQNLQIRHVKELIEQYDNGDGLVKHYCNTLLLQLEDMWKVLDFVLVEPNLKMLRFLEKNPEDLYVREASMLVYGDSKWFEKNNYDEICNIARNFLGIPADEDELNDTILAYYHVFPAEQEIFIKGDWRIEWDDYVLETKKLRGGIAIASNDVQHIKKIIVNSVGIMTIENKTSYQRMNSSIATMYLGGFANRYQIQFLKKVLQDNSHISFYHFGDIDVGGFLIHQHLCHTVGKKFELYRMGVEQLTDERFVDCLKELTDNDIRRMESLMKEEIYCEVLQYMKAHNVKLEQEIISYYETKSSM